MPEIPRLVKVFTSNVLTGSCSVTEFLSVVGVPRNFTKGERFWRIRLSRLYSAYKLFITAQIKESSHHGDAVPRKRFKNLVILNGYQVKRVSYCRAEIQGIQLNVLHLKAIFQKNGYHNFDEWLVESVGLSSAAYMLKTKENNDNRSKEVTAPLQISEHKSEMVDAAIRHVIVESKDQERTDTVRCATNNSMMKGFIEEKKQHALLKKAFKRLETEWGKSKETIQKLEEDNDQLWRSMN